MRNIHVTVDGSAKYRRMRAGFVVRDGDSNTVLECGSCNLGPGTNNEAEYRAAVHGCRAAMRYPGKITVFTDSQLMVRQLKGTYRVSAKLRPVYEEALQVFGKARAKIVWHRRDEGDGPLADSLASERKKEETDAKIQNDVVPGRDRESCPGIPMAERTPAS
jgi:ribonuclease HI